MSIYNQYYSIVIIIDLLVIVRNGLTMEMEKKKICSFFIKNLHKMKTVTVKKIKIKIYVASKDLAPFTQASTYALRACDKWKDTTLAIPSKQAITRKYVICLCLAKTRQGGKISHRQ